jgi:hypothetical protein
LMSAPFHVNFYLAPRSEVAERINNIKNYYFMQGIRAVVIPREIDNDGQSTLLMTYLHNVEVNARLLSSAFTET